MKTDTLIKAIAEDAAASVPWVGVRDVDRPGNRRLACGGAVR